MWNARFHVKRAVLVGFRVDPRPLLAQTPPLDKFLIILALLSARGAMNSLNADPDGYSIEVLGAEQMAKDFSKFTPGGGSTNE